MKFQQLRCSLIDSIDLIHRGFFEPRGIYSGCICSCGGLKVVVGQGDGFEVRVDMDLEAFNNQLCLDIVCRILIQIFLKSANLVFRFTKQQSTHSAVI